MASLSASSNISNIKIRLKRQEGVTRIRILIAHPMDSGFRKDGLGHIIPAHFIQEVTVKHQGVVIAQCLLNGTVSKDPYLSVRLNGGKPGEKIEVTWVDNLGQRDSSFALIH